MQRHIDFLIENSLNPSIRCLLSELGVPVSEAAECMGITPERFEAELSAPLTRKRREDFFNGVLNAYDFNTAPENTIDFTHFMRATEGSDLFAKNQKHSGCCARN